MASRKHVCFCSLIAAMLTSAANADITVVTFDPADVFTDTSEQGVAQLNQRVGIVGCTIEDFEDAVLEPELLIAYEGSSPSSTVSPEDIRVDYPDANWDGSASFLPTVRDAGNSLLPLTITLTTPVPTIGIGIGDVETDIELHVNGLNFGLITDLPGYAAGAPDNAREVYVRADAGAGELITSITLHPINSGAGDGVFLDHLAYGTPNRGDGLTHYWALDAMVDDIFGNASSVFIGTEDWQLGKYGFANVFSGSSYILTDWAPTVPAGGSFSFAAWVRHELPADANYYLLGLERTNHQEISLALNGNNDSMIVKFRDDDWNEIDAALPWTDTNDGDWHHVVGVLDGDAGTVTLYLDGVKRASVSGSLGSINEIDAQTFTIGANNNSNSGQIGPFPGAIDDLRFYNKALSPAEVRMLCPHTNRADFHPDGIVNTIDVLRFLDTWNTGRP